MKCLSHQISNIDPYQPDPREHPVYREITMRSPTTRPLPNRSSLPKTSNKLRRMSAALLVVAFLSGCAAVQEVESPTTRQARSALQHAPLGKLDKQGAYARYGQADRVIRLPDGHTGWVYEANDKRFAERTYTLDFAPDGLLHEVVYSSYSGERVSARQVQGQGPSSSAQR